MYKIKKVLPLLLSFTMLMPVQLRTSLRKQQQKPSQKRLYPKAGNVLTAGWIPLTIQPYLLLPNISGLSTLLLNNSKSPQYFLLRTFCIIFLLHFLLQ